MTRRTGHEDGNWDQRMAAAAAIFAQAEVMGDDLIGAAVSGDHAKTADIVREAAARVGAEVDEAGRVGFGEGGGNLTARTSDILEARTRALQNEAAIANIRDVLRRNGPIQITRIDKKPAEEDKE